MDVLFVCFYKPKMGRDSNKQMSDGQIHRKSGVYVPSPYTHRLESNPQLSECESTAFNKNKKKFWVFHRRAEKNSQIVAN